MKTKTAIWTLYALGCACVLASNPCGPEALFWTLILGGLALVFAALAWSFAWARKP